MVYERLLLITLVFASPLYLILTKHILSLRYSLIYAFVGIIHPQVIRTKTGPILHYILA